MRTRTRFMALIVGAAGGSGRRRGPALRCLHVRPADPAALRWRLPSRADRALAVSLHARRRALRASAPARARGAAHHPALVRAALRPELLGDRLRRLPALSRGGAR